jgi:ABC-type lipoprotein export system ATPase subunit
LCRQNLDYVVQNRARKSEKLAILKNLSGFFQPAEMAAVMGPSGSGVCGLPVLK